MSEEYKKLKERLLKRSKWNGECLESTYNGRSQNGYALVKFRSSTIGAHRASWLVHKGEIPEGLWVLHKCDNPLCMNIDHLFLGTPKENSKDMLEKGRHNYWGATKHNSEIVKNAEDMKRSGHTYKQISEKLDIPLPTVASFFRRTSMKEKVKDFYDVPKYSEEIKNEACELRKQGVKSKDIQKILNIPKRTLQRIHKFHKISS